MDILINPDLITVSELRQLDAKKLAKLPRITLIISGSEKLAAIIPYGMYIHLQSILKTVEDR